MNAWIAPAAAAALVGALWYLFTARGGAKPSGTSSLSWLRLVFLLGTAAAVWLWLVADQPMLSSAVMVATYGISSIGAARRRASHRLEEERHAAEAVGTASRSLRSGIPLSGMMHILAEESKGNARRAFREIVQRESLGEELTESIRKVLLTAPEPGLRAFGLALIVQLTAGGNIASTTDRLSLALIERDRVHRRARTIVAYSRMAALILAVLPIFAVTLLSRLVSGYSDFLFNTDEGHGVLATAAIMLTLGLLATQRLSRIEADGDGAAA